MVLHKFNSPDIKRQGLFSPCLFCKAVCILRIHKPDSVGPAGPGRHLAYDYYSILHLSLQETCIAFGGTPQARPVNLCTMLWYPAPGNCGFRPFSPIFRESGQITHSLSAGFDAASPIPDSGLFLHLHKSYPGKNKRTG